MEAVARAVRFECGVAAKAHAGEHVSGDRHVVAEFEGGALVAMIDALGHGHEAAQAADVAARVLKQHPRDPPRLLIERCHDEMRGTRGAAVSIASFDWHLGSLAWLGVGNVAGVVVYADAEAKPRVQQLLLRGGVVGDRLPALRPLTVPVAQGDLLVLATDGVREIFTEMLPGGGAPQQLAQRILDAHARRDDDASVLVLQVGAAP